MNPKDKVRTILITQSPKLMTEISSYLILSYKPMFASMVGCLSTHGHFKTTTMNEFEPVLPVLAGAVACVGA